ncbi:MAG: cell division protein SepF, partial [Clostridiales Family XIII bacterium]|nr:cell division protein SepF [Clostridiales Family XIII bacterium]
MAGVFGKLKTLVGLEDEYYDEEFTEEDLEPQAPRWGSNRYDREEERERDRRPAPQPSRYYDYEPPRQQRPRPVSQPQQQARPIESPRDREKVIAMRENTIRKITEQLKIVVIEPKSFNDCPKLVNALKSRKPIIINLEKIERESARNIFNFLNGATYALNGNVQKIAN